MQKQRKSTLFFFPLILLCLSGITFAQSAPGKLAFDVATIKPAAPLDPMKMAADMQSGKMPRLGPHIDASRATFYYMSLSELIATACKVKSYQVTGPPWLAGQRFDIEAKLPDGTSKDDVPAMLLALLEDRFKLTIHRETQEHKVLALVVAKGGAKLKASPAAPPPIDETRPSSPAR